MEVYRKRVERSWIERVNGHQILRTPTKQTGLCFHHHVARAMDYRQKIARARYGFASDFTVLTPPHASGAFEAKPFRDRGAYPNLALEAAIALGLPTTKSDHRFHLREHEYIAKEDIVVADLLKELREQGPFVVTFYPYSTFPPSPGYIYRKEGAKRSDLHANTVIGEGYDFVVEVDSVGQYHEKKENFFWLVENSWRNYEPYHRICHSVVEGAYICHV